TTTEAEPEPREWFGRVVLVAWFVALYTGATVQAAAVQDLLVPAAPPVLLLVGAYLDDILDSGDRQPVAALAVALGALIIGRAFSMKPEYYVGAHMLETVRWPGPLAAPPYVMVSYAAFFGGVVALLIGVPLAPRGASDAQRQRGQLILL